MRKIQLAILFFLTISFLGSVEAQTLSTKQLSKGLLIEALPSQSLSIPYYSSSTVILYETFETGGSGWSTTGSWAIGTPTSGPNGANNSSQYAATNLSGNYFNNANDWLISPTIILTASHSTSRFTLNLMEWFQLESSYDFGYIKISTDGGSTWSTLSFRDGRSDWREHQIDLTPYSNQEVILAFNLTSDGSVTFPGWYVDNLQVSRQDPQPLTATLISLDHQNFPFIFMNVAVDTSGFPFPNLTKSNFRVLENDVLQTDFFQVTPPQEGGGVRLADIVFVLDVSTSMEDEIFAVKNNMRNFIDSLATSEISYRVGFVVYANDNYVYNNGNLYSDQSQIISIINSVELDEHDVGSGNTKIPEDGFDALNASSLMNFRPGSQKILILITDAPCHYANDRIDYPSQDEGDLTSFTLETIASLLKNRNITGFVVGPDSNTDSGLNTTYGEFISTYPKFGGQFSGAGSLTEETNGTFYVVTTDFREIVQNIASTVGNTYVVTYKSSNPTLDGQQRTVLVEVTYSNYADTAVGTYIPGEAPSIKRTDTTKDLHTRAWAEGTTFNIEASIVDNFAPFVQSAKLFYKTTPVSLYSSTEMTLQGNDAYIGVIPGSEVLTPGMDYYIIATDGISTSSDPSTSPSLNPYQLAILPNVAPVITHTPITTLVPGKDIKVTANIADNTNFLSSAKLSYRKTGQLLYEEVDMKAIGENNYEAQIPSSSVTTEGVQYYLHALDDFGVGRYSGTSDDPYIVSALFAVSRDAYKFRNSTRGENPFMTNPLDLFPSWEVFRKAFGPEQTEFPDGTRKPSAEKFWKKIQTKGWGGSCDGFTSSAFRFHFSNSGLSFETSGLLFDIDPQNRGMLVNNIHLDDHIRQLVNSHQLYQHGTQVMGAIRIYGFGPLGNGDYRDFFNDLQNSYNLTGDLDKPAYLIGIQYTRLFEDGEFFVRSGHSLIPYEIVEYHDHPGIYRVYVYDPNFPFNPNDLQPNGHGHPQYDERYLVLDVNKKEWFFHLGPGANELFEDHFVQNSDDRIWSSHGPNILNPLILKNIAAYFETPRLPKQPETQIAALEPTTEELLELSINSSQITIWEDNQKALEIADSTIQWLSDKVVLDFPLYDKIDIPLRYNLLLTDGKFDIEFGGSSLDDSVYSIHVFQVNNVFTLETKPEHKGNLHVLQVQTGNAKFSYSPIETSSEYQAEIIALGSEAEKVICVQNSLASSRDTLSFALNLPSEAFSFENRGNSKSYDLKLRYVSQTSDTFFVEGISINSYAGHTLRIGNWDSLKTTSLVIEVDEGLDGDIDTLITLSSTPTSVSEESRSQNFPENFALLQNYPNPFNPETSIDYYIPKATHVILSVYNLLGQKIRTLVNEEKKPGYFKVRWDGTDEFGKNVASGIYVFQIKAGNFWASRKLIIMH